MYLLKMCVLKCALRFVRSQMAVQLCKVSDIASGQVLVGSAPLNRSPYFLPKVQQGQSVLTGSSNWLPEICGFLLFGWLAVWIISSGCCSAGVQKEDAKTCGTFSAWLADAKCSVYLFRCFQSASCQHDTSPTSKFPHAHTHAHTQTHTGRRPPGLMKLTRLTHRQQHSHCYN